ncbi:hypothetical protein FF1_010005 [Malus domestica]
MERLHFTGTLTWHSQIRLDFYHVYQNTNTDDQNDNNVETTGLPWHHVPKDVIHQILRLIHTIPTAHMSFLSKQWEGLRSSGCVLDFVEDNLDDEYDICEFFEILLFLKTLNGIKNHLPSWRLSLVQSRP